MPISPKMTSIHFSQSSFKSDSAGSTKPRASASKKSNADVAKLRPISTKVPASQGQQKPDSGGLLARIASGILSTITGVFRAILKFFQSFVGYSKSAHTSPTIDTKPVEPGPQSRRVAEKKPCSPQHQRTTLKDSPHASPSLPLEQPVVLPEPKTYTKISPERIPRDIWSEVLCYDLSIGDLCALRRVPFFASFVSEERKDLHSAIVSGAFRLFVTGPDLTATDAENRAVQDRILDRVKQCEHLTLDADRLAQAFEDQDQFLKQLGAGLDAATSLKAINIRGACGRGGNSSPHLARQIILEKLKDKPGLECLEFENCVFEMYELDALSATLRAGKNLERLSFATRWPNTPSQFDEAEREFTNLANAIKGHTKLKSLEICLLGGLSASMLDSFDDMLQGLPNVTNFPFSKVHSSCMFYNEAARQSFIRLLTNFSRAEVLDLSTFILTITGYFRETDDDPRAPTTTMTDIVEPIKKMKSLRVLRMGQDYMSDLQFNALIEGLKFCKNLTDLDLGNNVTDDRVKNLIQTLRSLPGFRNLTAVPRYFDVDSKEIIHQWVAGDPQNRSVKGCL